MNSNGSETVSGRGSLFRWLARLNGEVSQWAASVSWWRLILLFLIILIASSIIGGVLNLKHDRVRVSDKDNEVVVSIGGRNIVIAPGAHKPASSADGDEKDTDSDSVVGEIQKEIRKELEQDKDLQELRGLMGKRRVVTVRGIVGDLLSALMVILFAYLAAAKIVVKKVAQADAKVRTAIDAAEREAMERQLVQARLQVLQAQVEPHFLFNTLSAVDYLIETEPPRASRMQKALITYLRGALPQMRQESSTVGRELRLIKSYLELIKMRIEDRLEVEIAVPDGLESAQFPPMMLQSLVENSIKHGIEPKPEGGKVRVAAGVQNAQLWVEVSDTGVGVPDGEMLDSPTSGTGIGLQNIRERLAVLYPGKSRLMLRSDPATGTIVRITVPYQVDPDVAAEAEAKEFPEGKPA
jgi:signal transduction histidine kinase